MYEKNIFYFIVCLFIVISFSGCRTTLYDNRIGDVDYRELESELQDGERELAVTSQKLEQSSSKLEETVNGIEQSGKYLEQSIGESDINEQRIEELLQRIKERRIPENIANDIRNMFIN